MHVCASSIITRAKISLMTLDEFRLEMEQFRLSVEDEAAKFKDPYIALERLQTLYRSFDKDERLLADQVLGEWVLSESESACFEALVLIEDFKITTAVPQLVALIPRLEGSLEPGAPFLLKKVRRKIEMLTSAMP
jgi:hypothetical protein